jgi:hypothetical protein
MVVNEEINDSKDSIHSSLSESIIEHLFVGKILETLWIKNLFEVEVLKPQVDDAGYDLVIDCNSSQDKNHSSIRYIQLKSSRSNAKTARVNVSLKLTKKPNWCVIWIIFEQTETTLELKHFRIFPDPDKPHPNLKDDSITFKKAKHTKGNSIGDKAVRPEHRVVPKKEFKTMNSIKEVVDWLFTKAQSKDVF